MPMGRRLDTTAGRRVCSICLESVSAWAAQQKQNNRESDTDLVKDILMIGYSRTPSAIAHCAGICLASILLQKNFQSRKTATRRLTLTAWIPPVSLSEFGLLFNQKKEAEHYVPPLVNTM